MSGERWLRSPGWALWRSGETRGSGRESREGSYGCGVESARRGGGRALSPRRDGLVGGVVR